MFSTNADRRFAARDDSVFPFARRVVWSVSIMTVTMGWILAAGSMAFSATYTWTDVSERVIWGVSGAAVTRVSWDADVNVPWEDGADLYYNLQAPTLWYDNRIKDGIHFIEVGLLGVLTPPTLGLLLWARQCARSR